MKTSALGMAAVFLLVSGCGGEVEMVPPPAAPPPDTAKAQLPVPENTASAVATTPPPIERRPMLDLQREAISNMLGAFAEHNPKKIAALYTDDVVSGSVSPLGWQEEGGKLAIERGHTSLFAGFPNMVWKSPRVFAKGNVVVQEWVSNATHTGDMGDMVASGKPTGIYGVSVYWFNEDGLIKRDHTYYDGATIAIQTGEMPGKTRAIPQVPGGDPIWILSSDAPDEQKRVETAKAMYAAFAGKDEKAFLSMLDNDVVHTSYASAVDSTGLKAAAEGRKTMHKAFPNLKNTITNAWAFGDKVALEVAMEGTQDGALGSIKASKKAVKLHSLDIVTFGKDEKIIKVQSYGSTLELLGQIGALEAAKRIPIKASKKN